MNHCVSLHWSLGNILNVFHLSLNEVVFFFFNRSCLLIVPVKWPKLDQLGIFDTKIETVIAAKQDSDLAF